MGGFMLSLLPPAWPMKLPIIHGDPMWKRSGESGGILRVQRGKGWGHTMKCSTGYSCNPANRDRWQLSQPLRTDALRERNSFRSFPRRPLSCQSKNEKHPSRDSFKSVKSKSCSITLIPSMPYLLTLRAIMEKLYCAVLSLSSNSLVAMVPSVPSIVK